MFADLKGCLVKATRMRGIQGFKPRDNNLFPLRVDTWGPLVFLNLGDAMDAPAAACSTSASSSTCSMGALFLHAPEDRTEGGMTVVQPSKRSEVRVWQRHCLNGQTIQLTNAA